MTEITEHSGKGKDEEVSAIDKAEATRGIVKADNKAEGKTEELDAMKARGG